MSKHFDRREPVCQNASTDETADPPVMEPSRIRDATDAEDGSSMEHGSEE